MSKDNNSQEPQTLDWSRVEELSLEEWEKGLEWNEEELLTEWTEEELSSDWTDEELSPEEEETDDINQEY